MIDCRRCHRPDLKTTDMVQDKSSVRGHKTLCKVCKQADKVAPRPLEKLALKMSQALTPSQRKSIGVGVYTARIREPNEATGVLIIPSGTYRTPPQHQRNDGLKHIPSRGVQC